MNEWSHFVPFLLATDDEEHLQIVVISDANQGVWVIVVQNIFSHPGVIEHNHTNQWVCGHNFRIDHTPYQP